MLRYSEELLEKEGSIQAIFFKAQKELDARKKLYDEFRRKLTDEELASLDDENIKVPMQRYLTIMAVGYFAGKPPIYKVQAYDKEIDKLNTELFGKDANDEQKVKEMEYIVKHITDYNDDGTEFWNLAFDYFCKRACYEILYENDSNEIVYTKADALETIAIWDFSLPAQLIGLMRLYRYTLADGSYKQMVELTTKNGKKYYDANKEKIELFSNKEAYKQKYGDTPLFKEDKKKKEPKKWDDLQVIAIENEHNINLFEEVDSLISAYERVIQNSRNTFKYNDEAILKVKGYAPENPLIIIDDEGHQRLNPARKIEDEYVLTSRVRYLDADGDIDWVIKQVNDSALQNHKQTLMDLICLLAFVPNMTDLGFTQADNNSALEKKFFSLQQYVTEAKGQFVKGLNRRWELIFNKFNKNKGKKYDFRNIEITLEPNIPTDMESAINMALQLRDLLSDESVINLLPFNLDAKNELAKKENESENNIDRNQEIIKRFSQRANNDLEQIEENKTKEIEEPIEE